MYCFFKSRVDRIDIVDGGKIATLKKMSDYIMLANGKHEEINWYSISYAKWYNRMD